MRIEQFLRRINFTIFNFFGRTARINEVKHSILFDEEYYVSQQMAPIDGDPALHYVQKGWKSGLNPSAYFDQEFYLSRYTDVKDSNVNPLKHYLTHGFAEGRAPSPEFDRALFLTHHPDLKGQPIDAAAECIKLYGTYQWQMA